MPLPLLNILLNDLILPSAGDLIPSAGSLLIGNGELGDILLIGKGEFDNEENPLGIRLGMSITNIPSFPFSEEQEEEGMSEGFPDFEMDSRGCI